MAEIRDDRICSLVTGGASGIGRSVCLTLAKHGPVGVLDQNLEGSAETVARVAEEGGDAVALEADVTSLAAMEGAAAEFRRWWGRIDAAVACAGIDATGTALDEPEGNWDRVMAVNAKGVYLTARAVLPYFVDQQRGSFVAIASDAGVMGAQDFGVYTASKHAVVGLVKTLALDFARDGVRCNAVCPAFVQTPMSEAHLAGSPSGEEQYYKGTVPMGRFARPQEVAEVIEFLVLPASGYMTGSVYPVDGGATAGFNYGR